MQAVLLPVTQKSAFRRLSLATQQMTALRKLRRLRRVFLSAHGQLFAHATRLSLQKHMERSQEKSLHLGEVLTHLTREIHLYSLVANPSVRFSLQPIIQDGLIFQKKAEEWKRRFTPPFSNFNDLTYEKETLCEIDLFLAGLVSLIRRSLDILEGVHGRLSPMAAYRVRHLIYNSEMIVLECLPPLQRKAWRTPLRTLLLHPTLWTSRLLVSVSVLPLVLLFDAHLQKDSQGELPSIHARRSPFAARKLGLNHLNLLALLRPISRL